ncbi:MAG: 30S ribosomal protein S8 [Candidatus Taylorbacteria bacterium RIFCSPLOWO2_12_FULL_43_20]|uniref:Small ribosomal subunit protein uS8 n=1 Tax=Candidatus Taylorbacteria bacterium RIFCSPLOWO2_12_FULL_43_20 TaxID=1802332 RepID=A0A1G2P4C8_9BACT|nr:MAG: 30S ribosomal protein S8 [Candidatus Taylorbacteria bacterium RIFCSPHIGHO2_01_FULL_43_120]OHA23459.1 MAG: 30S ribosomal protein S8 [Candidatus Taylorbacteria bacterium RIFCSPHIGHO2_02_FULL_43_55]OHA29664.1 MAG: 30S ribosomal protein S8 [Candidatus Taylorbacteria bacterium RIFCSPHIGHO2_12_FULL_42_34]OHA31592.1 MAG: 30S ribosomal protein S8 [Candidatus Taylorbacteria bacterium RIFCSPLOWO2_01_FULL_43_83]OHA38973.1 MAG: 30S ribosomal protein S8 [Candidatus Taylorbacteria bacterium RIFCSPLOW
MDTIANFIIQLKNASQTGKETVFFPHSKMCAGIADVLEKEGFIKVEVKKGKKTGKLLEIKIQSVDGNPKITNVKRISKPSKRIYYAANQLRPVRSGFGRLILSTSKGILSGKQARDAKMGGEALFEIW